MLRAPEEHHVFNENVSSILERITDGFYAVDNDWKITYWNKQAEKLLGKHREEVLGRSLWECFPEAVDLDFYRQYHTAFQQQQPRYFVAYFPPLDSWSEVNIYPSRNGLSVFFRDITERIRSEEEMKMLSLIAKETVNSVSFVNPLGEIIWVNASFTKVTGYTSEEVIGHKHSELLFGPDTDHNTVENMVEKMKKGRSFNVELLVYTKSEEKKWLDVTCECLFDDNGQIRQYFLIHTDITETKKSKEEVERLSLIVKTAPNGVALLDMNKHIAWINESFSRITGYSAMEAVGKRPGELIRGAETDIRKVKQLHQRWEKLEGFQFENVYYHKSGEKIILDLSCQPLFDNAGKVNQFFIIIKDLSEKKKLQEQLLKEKVIHQKDVTKAAIKAQEQERANVGRELHDNVNQVLTTVKLYTELCIDGMGNTQDMLKRSALLLNETINEIRSLSNRLSAPSIGSVRLKDSIRDLVEAVSATNKVAISFRASRSLNEFHANEELHLAIYRIVQEHLTNILKHAGASNVLIQLSKTMKAITLKVTDDGKGFDLKARRKGIGIINMTSRAESIDGKIWFETAPGKGCVLTGIFPLASKVRKQST